nr:MAG TPA: hypothetical protein [Caudoviricetes sp.]
MPAAVLVLFQILSGVSQSISSTSISPTIRQTGLEEYTTILFKSRRL